MAETTDTTVLEQPRVYLVHMMVFTLVVVILALVLLPSIQRAFMANPGLNGVIVGTLLLGMFHSYRMVWRLFPEVNWVNQFRESEDSAEVAAPPQLLGPVATLLRNRQSNALSPVSMRSMLDSMASRLDENRDLSRYLVGLLIFLGLLGTFWGLLETVSSVGDAIRALDVTSSQSSTVFEELKSGLERPLAGMGLSFSSSLFGLSGSLILGFLDLKAAQAQTRFYNDLEDWLSSITTIAATDGVIPAAAQPQPPRTDVVNLQKAIDKLSSTVDAARATPAAKPAAASDVAMEQLADAVAALVSQMREEQKMVRQWAQSQQVQQNEIQRLLLRLTGQPAPAPRARAEREE